MLNGKIMTLTPATKKKLLGIARTMGAQPHKIYYNFGITSNVMGWDLNEMTSATLKWTDDEDLYNLFGKTSGKITHKLLARVIRRFVRTGVLEFKKSEVRE
jgi:hypothetical protein